MDFYVNLTYDQYKALEKQLRRYWECETTHSTAEGAYHKAFRLTVGDVVFEFQGPLVKPPLRETHPV